MRGNYNRFVLRNLCVGICVLEFVLYRRMMYRVCYWFWSSIGSGYVVHFCEICWKRVIGEVEICSIR